MAKKITLVLENCESFVFNAEDVDLYLDGISTHILGGEEFTKAEHIAISIKENAEGKPEADWGDSNWQTRIKQDITQIHVDDKCYWPMWGEGEYENENETDIIGYGRYIYIISETRKSMRSFH